MWEDGKKQGDAQGGIKTKRKKIQNFSWLELAALYRYMNIWTYKI